jgi:hypothetical protein
MKNPFAKAEKYLNKVVKQLKAKGYKGKIDVNFIFVNGYAQNISPKYVSKAILVYEELKQKGLLAV